MFKKALFALLVSSAALVPTVNANASTMDLFTLTKGSTTYSFTLPASGTPSLGNTCPTPSSQAFCYNSVTVDKNHVLTTDTIEFFKSSEDGGLELFIGNMLKLNLEGAQLFTGSVSAPTFKLGTFTFGSGDDEGEDNPYRLTIAAATSPVPEPSSLALMCTGLLTAAGVVRRRFQQ